MLSYRNKDKDRAGGRDRIISSDPKVKMDFGSKGIFDCQATSPKRYNRVPAGHQERMSRKDSSPKMLRLENN